MALKAKVDRSCWELFLDLRTDRESNLFEAQRTLLMPQWSTYLSPVEYCINIVASLNIAGGRGTTRVGRGFKCGYRIHVLVFVPNLQRNIQFFPSISHSTQIVIYTSNLNYVYPSVCRLWTSGLILFYFSVYVSTDPAIVFFFWKLKHLSLNIIRCLKSLRDRYEDSLKWFSG